MLTQIPFIFLRNIWLMICLHNLTDMYRLIVQSKLECTVSVFVIVDG